MPIMSRRNSSFLSPDDHVVLYPEMFLYRKNARKLGMSNVWGRRFPDSAASLRSRPPQRILPRKTDEVAVVRSNYDKRFLKAMVPSKYSCLLVVVRRFRTEYFSTFSLKSIVVVLLTTVPVNSENSEHMCHSKISTCADLNEHMCLFLR